MVAPEAGDRELSSAVETVGSAEVRGDLAVLGPMARSASDLALALDVLAGPGPVV